MEDAVKPAFPNNLRSIREAQYLTRNDLVIKSANLAAQDGTTYTQMGASALRDLELGLRRPRRATARTLAKVLDKTIEELFPSGIDDLLRNPRGRTRIPSDRPKGGRPKKK